MLAAGLSTWMHINSEPRPNTATTTPTPNSSAALNESSAIPPRTTAALIFVSASVLFSVISLLLAAQARRWLAWFLSHKGSSVADRCVERQHKYEEFKKWRFNRIVRTSAVIPHMIALPLLICGLCLSTRFPASPAIYLLFAPIAIGVLFFLTHMVPRILDAFPLRASPLIVLCGLLKSIRSSYRFLSHWSCFPPSNTQLAPTAMDDTRCALWMLWTGDLEVFDTAIPHATMIPYSEVGTDIEPQYAFIVSVLKASFDSTGRVRPGLRNRVFYSGQAILWIHSYALCYSVELAQRFPLPAIHHQPVLSDPKLQNVLAAYSDHDISRTISRMYLVPPTSNPLYLQWTSSILLHLSWAMRTVPDTFNSIGSYNSPTGSWSTAPLGAVLNRLLASCVFLGWSIEEDLLRVRDKS